MKKLLLFFVFLSPFWLTAQSDSLTHSASSPLQQLEVAMKSLALTVLTDSIQQNRLEAHEQLKTKMQEALQMPGSFDYPFAELPSISFQYPDDRSFRVVTWQLYVDMNTYRYAGYLQSNAPQPQLTVLMDRANEVEDPEYDILDADHWFGAVYYNIKSFNHPEGRRYLLFGFNGYQLFHKRKFIDVLSFDQGVPVFGATVFQSNEPNRPDLAKNRLVLTYSAETYVRLNYDENLSLIVFDNLLVGAGALKGQGPVMLPDGSYCGYQLKKGNWVYVDKLFDHTYDSAPRPQPVLGNGRKGKNVFGN
ncbi:MAG: hypothetical protein AAGD05_01325 [Bacteroidota bacterium]